MKNYRKHFRSYRHERGLDTDLEVWTDAATGEVDQVMIGDGADKVWLTGADFYAMIDAIASIDPDTWAKRHPDEKVEQALLRLRELFRERAMDLDRRADTAAGTTRISLRSMGDVYSIAVGLIQDEIARLHKKETA